jgi:hypothetical protein
LTIKHNAHILITPDRRACQENLGPRWIELRNEYVLIRIWNQSSARPFRRFVQNETFSPQANEIPNTAASWLPGDDYYTNFHEGDPFLKVPEGYARLPGAGYEALLTWKITTPST